MAEQSVDTLIRIVEGERLESLVIEAPPVLVERASTAPPPRLDIERGG
jgi:DNA-binding LacI/PurR family transcriptional regulator